MILIYQSPGILSFPSLDTQSSHPYNPQPPTNSHPLVSPTKAAIPEAATLSGKAQVKTTGLERFFFPKYITCLVMPLVPRKNVLKVYFLFFCCRTTCWIRKNNVTTWRCCRFLNHPNEKLHHSARLPTSFHGKRFACFDVWKDVSPRKNMVRILTKPAWFFVYHAKK